MSKRKTEDKSGNVNITLYEDDLYERQEVKEETVQFVVFRLSQEWYGVDISKTKEVITIGTITFLPSSPFHVSGIVALRGNILSVTDIKKIFGLPQAELTKKSRLVVIESGVLETGLLVDEVDEVIDVPVQQIEPTLTTITPEKAECMTGSFYTKEKLIGILKVEEILKK